MNALYINQTTDTEILEAAIEDARAFVRREACTLWDLCDCIGDQHARDAVEDLVGLVDHLDPAADTIAMSINRIIMPLLTIPFSLVDVIEQETRLNGGLGNAIKYYGPRLTDISARLLRAASGSQGQSYRN